MPDTEEEGALKWPPLSADICDQMEEGTVYMCRKKELEWVGEWRMRRHRNIISFYTMKPVISL